MTVTRRLRCWIARAAGMLTSRRDDRDMLDEIESHLAMHTEENIRRGMAPEAARRAARIRLGNVAVIGDAHREQRRLPFLAHLDQDVRYAARAFRRSPGFTAVAVLTIAFGVFGPTVTFTMAKAWILDPLPFSRPDDLVDVRTVDTVSGDLMAVNVADLLDWRRSAGSFEHLAAYRLDDVRLTGGNRAERLRAAEVTVDFFRTLGTAAFVGRVFDATDDVGATRPIVVSHAIWREQLDADTGVTSARSLQLDGEPHTVVGVLPEWFQFTLAGRVDVWKLLVFSPEDGADRRSGFVRVLGLLRPGRTLQQARGELTMAAERLSELHPDTNARRGVRVWPLADEIRMHHDMGFLVPVLFAMVACVLVVACVNVTNIMLARASTRRQEIAVRIAIGASRARIVRQWVVEHVLLFVVASAIGAALAVYGANWITNSIPADNRQYLRNYAVLSVDRVVLLFALVVGVACGVLFGWLPAWTGMSTDVSGDLRETGARAATSRGGARLRSALVIGEVAVALALVISAGLLVQTGRNITRIDLGFDPQRLLAFQMSLEPQQYPEPEAVRAFYDRLTADLASRPGVIAAAAGSLVPFGNQGNGVEFFIDREPDPKPADTPFAALNQVTPDYVRTIGLRLRRGRALNSGDESAAPKVAMISETLALRHFAGRDPIGQRLRLGRESADVWTIVGVVGDVKNYQTIDPPEPQVYVPLAQHPSRRMTLVVRSSGAPETLIGPVRSAAAALAPLEPVTDLTTMEMRVRRVTAHYRTVSTFVGFFGAVTLLLAGVGVYGTTSYSFAQRTKEIGIRIALGARRADVAALVLTQLRRLLLWGICPGILLAWTIANALRAYLVGVTPTDWRLYLTMCSLLVVVALLAALVPTRRATTIDPLTALRRE